MTAGALRRPRPRTRPVKVGDRTTRATVQRCCNGCGRRLGDITHDEADAAMCGAPVPDVRGECPVCTPNPPGLSWHLDLPISLPLASNERAAAALRAAVRAMVRVLRIPPLKALSAELHYPARASETGGGAPPDFTETLTSCIDGLVDANVVPDGSPRHVTPAEPVLDPPSGERPSRLVLIVREHQPRPDDTETGAVNE